MSCSQKSPRAVAKTAFAVAYLLSAAAPIFAQEPARPATEKWRPKNGVYAEPGASFNARCGEFGDLIVELAEKAISGGEEDCKIVKLADTVPGTITLNIACTEINRQKPYKEVMLLKKTGEKTIFLRETLNGKFKRPGGLMSYCSEEVQRMYTDSKKGK